MRIQILVPEDRDIIRTGMFHLDPCIESYHIRRSMPDHRNTGYRYMVAVLMIPPKIEIGYRISPQENGTRSLIVDVVHIGENTFEYSIRGRDRIVPRSDGQQRFVSLVIIRIEPRRIRIVAGIFRIPGMPLVFIDVKRKLRLSLLVAQRTGRRVYVHHPGSRRIGLPVAIGIEVALRILRQRHKRNPCRHVLDLAFGQNERRQTPYCPTGGLYVERKIDTRHQRLHLDDHRTVGLCQIDPCRIRSEHRHTGFRKLRNVFTSRRLVIKGIEIGFVPYFFRITLGRYCPEGARFDIGHHIHRSTGCRRRIGKTARIDVQSRRTDLLVPLENTMSLPGAQIVPIRPEQKDVERTDFTFRRCLGIRSAGYHPLGRHALGHRRKGKPAPPRTASRIRLLHAAGRQHNKGGRPQTLANTFSLHSLVIRI